MCAGGKKEEVTEWLNDFPDKVTRGKKKWGDLVFEIHPLATQASWQYLDQKVVRFDIFVVLFKYGQIDRPKSGFSFERKQRNEKCREQKSVLWTEGAAALGEVTHQ